MIQFIQNKLLKPGMVSHFHHNRPPRAFVPLPDARSIGILADVRTPGSLPFIVQFARQVHRPERRCHLLLLVPHKRKDLTPFDYEKNFPGMPVEIICLDEMNLFKVPSKNLTQPFVAARFDILFYLETGLNFSLESVLYHSHARMYAGASGLCNGILDFEIELNERPELSYLAENLLKYLQEKPKRTEGQTKQEENDKFTLF